MFRLWTLRDNVPYGIDRARLSMTMKRAVSLEIALSLHHHTNEEIDEFMDQMR
jgi:hypothetical protein